MRRSRKLPASHTKKARRLTSSSSKNFSSARLSLGIVCIFIGLFALVFPVLYKSSSGSKMNVSQHSGLFGPFIINKELLAKNVPQAPPIRIVIPSVSIDLPIVTSQVTGGFWEISETSASYGIGSGYPGQTGNMVVFAHARQELFGPLRDIKMGSTIYIFTSDTWHRYTVRTTKLVDPTAIEEIAPTNEETLTLFTCSGFLDTKRLIVKAYP